MPEKGSVDTTRIATHREELKKCIILTAVLEDLDANHWYATQGIYCFFTIALKIYYKLSKKIPQTVLLALSMGALIGSLIISLYSLIPNTIQTENAMYYLLVLNSIFIIPVSIMTIALFVYTIKDRYITEQMTMIYMIAILFHYCFGFLACLLFIDTKIVFAYLMLSFLYLTTLLFNVIFTISVILIPILLLVFFLEILIRLILCKIRCPTKRHIVIKYEYIPRTYSESNAEDVKECVICMNKYKDDDIVICLGCHKSHILHEKCLLEWAKKEASCPICRKKLPVAKL